MADVRRGVSLFPDDPGPPPPEKLQAGQPGRAWQRIGLGGWAVECKDGSRVAVFGSKVVYLRGATR